MNAAAVREALLTRWPPSEYLSITEAPQHSDRSGRKLDVLVVSLWKSRGLELEGVEIKVSMSDWRRELKNAEKADWWWAHVHRFWIAVPAPLAEKVRPELPPGWGLLACSPGTVDVVVKAEKHAAEPLTWPTCVGLMRASANVGLDVLAFAERRGEARGYERARTAFEQTDGDERLRGELSRLEACVAAFEEASGISIERWSTEARRTGEFVALARRLASSPQDIRTTIEHNMRQLTKTGETLRTLLDVVAPPETAMPSADVSGSRET